MASPSFCQQEGKVSTEAVASRRGMSIVSSQIHCGVRDQATDQKKAMPDQKMAALLGLELQGPLTVRRGV